MTPPASARYFDLDQAQSDYRSARAAILPVPYERTTSWGQGTAGGPRAILEASQQVELWDEKLGGEATAAGVATLPAVEPLPADPVAALPRITEAARRPLDDGKLLVALGGEHSITAPLVAAALASRGPLAVVQFDAHADLRDEYQGSKHSHACAMRRVRELQVDTLAVGIRAISRPESELVRRLGLPVVWGWELEALDGRRWRELLDRLPPRVYLTFDLDFFDPALVPATGTPEPGGGAWYPTLGLLRDLFRLKEVVAMDVVELAPIAGQPASDFLAAKLVWKCLGFGGTEQSGGPDGDVPLP